MLTKHILKKFGDAPIKKVKIEALNQTTQVINESLATLMQRNTSDNGYEWFEMDNWYNLETPLEQEILEQLKEKLVNVEGFRVSGMVTLPTLVRDQLAEFAADVIEQHESEMKMLYFNSFTRRPRLTASEERLFRAVCCSQQTNLQRLGLSELMPKLAGELR